MKRNKFTALLLSGIMATAALTGCGGVDKEAVVATFDGTEVPLGVANFAARLQQASYDDFYVAYFGENVWSSDLYGNGTTMESEVKDSVLESLFDMYTLEAHMGDYEVTLSEEEKSTISQAAADFIVANEKDALDALGADQETVERYLTLATIQSRMQDAIIADADTNVSDEEANTSAYSYVRVSKTSYTDADGNSAQYTEEELAELAKKVGNFDTEAKAGTLEDAAENYEYSVSNGTFTAEDTDVEEAVLTALKGLEEGEVSDVIDTDSYYYVVRLDAETDEEATEETRQDIISERQSSLYDEVLSGWEESHEWKVDDKVWGKVSFDNLFTTVVESTETEDAGTGDAGIEAVGTEDLETTEQ